MQTAFTPEQLQDPEVARSNEVLRSCVHCGFCTATCPTYVELGDERDSPRGRIYLIKEMLEKGGAPDPAVVTHVDRCLSCLSCMTTCPSGVHYMHLVDHARNHIAAHHERPAPDRLVRRLLGFVLPRPGLFRLALIGGLLARPFRAILPGRLGAMLKLAPARLPGRSPLEGARVHRAEGTRRKRVALLQGCAQVALAPEINEATIRLLTRHGVEVVVAEGASCCGALNHHMGQHDAALALVKGNVAAWTRELDGEGLDAIVINASGCGTTVKDYGHMLRNDRDWAARAAAVSALTRDISELLEAIDLPAGAPPEPLAVAYHAACSLQHGQRVRHAPKLLLARAGFEVREIGEAHLCCGSAGTYNLLQPAMAERLAARKVGHIEAVRPDVVATGNIGCLMQIGGRTAVPVVHTVELLDWATGGPKPRALMR
ncbi:glycolate oxidase subunit GlcF [Oceanibacterium hippocampi]|uniref:Glycolate oxidase iron-sulfur subunit n=1 Tax=Oceanibacterium hippocampi TaxID=745714 RepID=A0A1Y5SAN6_9PROT|nr:glycolate oxidase subunit GlcF [Oceanibacterium hippocampi]SLN35208.1 Lactate utilization protein A [Oceanibacterium hippocampi]